MGHAQKLIFTFVFWFGLSAQAEWQATLSHMGYFGHIALGAIYDWQKDHSAELSLGLFSMKNKDYGQVNLAYRYSRWQVRRQGTLWAPMQVGVFATRSMDDSHYFRSSPSKYPSANYYDQTAIRGGLEFGSSLLFEESHLALAYHLRVLDSGLIAIYNNANQDLQYYVSSALSLRYHF